MDRSVMARYQCLMPVGPGVELAVERITALLSAMTAS